MGFDRNGIADLDETIALIYEAALDPALWPDVLPRITDQTLATGTLLLVLEPSASHVLAKTDTYRQTELVRLLLTSAVVRNGRPDAKSTARRA